MPDMDPVITHFARTDAYIHGLILRYGLPRPRTSANHFAELANCIVSQQLSDKAASSIWKKFGHLLSGSVTPSAVLSVPEPVLRTAGLSSAKARYIANAARAFTDGTVDAGRLERMSDEEIVAALTTVKGIGRWTAEMFLMFSLGREDVFSAGDLGLRKAVAAMERMPELPDASRMKTVSDRWRPYRTYAALLLWKSLTSV